VVSRVIQKEEVAEEVLQDCFLKIWDKIESYDPAKGKLFTWMLNLTRNLAIDKTRSKEIHIDGKTLRVDNLVSNIESSQFVESNVEGIGLNEVLKSLSQEQYFVIEHLYFKGYTQAELGKEFNIPLGTVKTRLRLAMQKLKQTLAVEN
jgi:RNA polymerase sigma-70 factor (ECF subfamily)